MGSFGGVVTKTSASSPGDLVVVILAIVLAIMLAIVVAPQVAKVDTAADSASQPCPRLLIEPEMDPSR